MMNSNPARAYRQCAVQGASPMGLILMLYDAAVASLHRAIAAFDANDIESRTSHLNHVLDVVAELQGSLNIEKGGKVAKHLDRFYTYARGEIFEANIRNSKEELHRLVEQFLSLREAWQQMEKSASLPSDKTPENIPSAPAQSATSQASGANSLLWRA